MSPDKTTMLLNENRMLARRLERVNKQMRHFVALHDRAMKLREYSDREKKIQDMYNTLLLNNIPDIIFILDPELCFHLGSSAFRLFLGRENSENLVNWSFDQLFRGIMPEDRIQWTRSQLESAMSERRQMQYREEIRLGNDKRVFDISIVPAIDQNDAIMGVVCIMRDTTEQAVLMARLEDLATTDPLTGLLNRRHFLTMAASKVAMAARSHMRMWVIIYDLDRFKQTNDTYGHAAGDYVLIKVSSSVKKQLRPYDVFARYGGEEFAIFAMGLNTREDAAEFTERLRRAAEQIVVFGDARIPVTASFGIAEYLPNGNLEDAILAADAAMYRAKEGGRNRVEF